MSSYQCMICYGPTSLKGGGLCFYDAMAIGGKAVSELWCQTCQDKPPEAPLKPPRPLAPLLNAKREEPGVAGTMTALRALAASAE